ncbi:MAG: hypothetical protein OEM52_11790, partial [bacterium]|nr:hypothetical protein [bacterium]
MRMFAIRLLFVLFCGVPIYSIATDALSASHRSQNPATSTPIPKPFFFTENKGQWDSRVLYKCQAKNGMTWFLERDGITLLVSREQGTGNRELGRGRPSGSPAGDAVRRTFLSDDYSGRGRPAGSPNENDLPELLRRHPQKNHPMKSHALKFHFVNGEGSKVNGERSTKNNSENLDQSFSTLHPSPYTLHQSFSTLHRASAQSVEAHGELPWKNNYFLGNDSSKWAPNCRNFSTVVYREVWDGIDVEWYENDGKLEFDFIVHPGFDPSQIRMSVEGLEGDRISGFGDRETGLSLRERPAPKQSHLDNGSREPETGNSRGVPRTPAGNVRDLLRDSRTTGGTVHRQKMSDGEMDSSRDRRPCLSDSRGEPRTPAVTGVGQTILSDKYSSRGRPSGSPDGNVRDLLRDSRTTGGTVHRQKMSDGVKDSS